MGAGWYFDDSQTRTRYFTESYSMSVSDFAWKVSIMLGHEIETQYIGAIGKTEDVERYHHLIENKQPDRTSMKKLVYISME